MLAWPSHSCTLPMSASCASAFVSAVARSAWTQKPGDAGVVFDDPRVNRAGGEGFLQVARDWIFHWPK